MRTALERFVEKIDKQGPIIQPKLGPCWVWTAGIDADGYGRFRLGTTHVGAHRAAFFFEHGRWPDPFALHHCDHRPCVRPSHLFEGTPLDNMQDKIRKGRLIVPFGVEHPHARLTDADVREIRARSADGETFVAIGRRFDLGKGHARDIARGIYWKHVT